MKLDNYLIMKHCTNSSSSWGMFFSARYNIHKPFALNINIYPTSAGSTTTYKSSSCLYYIKNPLRLALADPIELTASILSVTIIEQTIDIVCRLYETNSQRGCTYFNVAMLDRKTYQNVLYHLFSRWLTRPISRIKLAVNPFIYPLLVGFSILCVNDCVTTLFSLIMSHKTIYWKLRMP